MSQPSFKHSPLALCALLALGALPAHAQVAANTLPVVRPGGAVINATVAAPVGNTLAITQTQSASNRGLVEWSSFSIGSAARVTIIQPNAQSLLVNRVTGSGSGPTASEIHGAMTANGRVLLVNPAGVIFGSSAQVNTGSLVASAIDLAPSMTGNNYASLMNGDHIALSGGAGTIHIATANDPRAPQIQVTEGDSIILISQSQIEHHGVISAPRGEINMTNASDATLRAVGTSGFVQLAQATPSEPQSSTLTTGLGSQTLAAGGRIVIGGQLREEGGGRADNLSIGGVVSTASSTGNGGSIHIDAGAGGSLAVSDASITAASTTATGGHVTLLGNNITLQRGEQAGAPEVIVDGATGGGRIEIGDTRTRAVLVNDNVLLSADATRNGHGGQIRLRAMYEDRNASSPVPRADFGVTEAYGVLRARGGTEGGNGGQIETSGMAVTTALANAGGVTFKQASIDARARAAGGTAGAWTLDPYNVSISNAPPQDVSGGFEPTGPGANVQASDVVAALNAGTSVVISTEAGGAGTQAGNITVAPGTSIIRTAGTAPTTLTLRANNNILVDGSTIGSTGAGPVNLVLHSDVDGNGSGSIAVVNSTLSTAGGNITASGGLSLATGYAQGDASNAGVSITASSIDTVNVQTGGAGDITLRGRAGASPGAPAGVRLDGNFTFGNLTVDGRASHGTAVLLNGADLNGGQGAGNIDIRGIAVRTDSLTATLTGIEADGTRMVVGSGTLTLAGRGDDASIFPSGAVGLRIGDLEIANAGATAGTVRLVGQSTGGSIAPGIQVAPSASTGLVIEDDGSPANVNLVIGALSDVRASSLELGVAGVPPTINVTGTVNIRPLGVSGTTGDLVEQTTVPITIIPRGSNAGAGTFTLQSELVATGGISAGGGIVVGSRAHSGAIVVDTNAFPVATAPARLTLQNEGTGSSGITLRAGNTFGNLGLLSAGNIGQATGSITTQDLVIRGGAATTVTLDSATNQINGNFAFDPPAALTLRTAGDLTVDAASTAAYDATSTTPFAPLSITGSVGGNTALLQAGGDIQVNQPITMTGTSGPRLELAAPTGTVTFATGAALSAPGGLWRIWAPTVVNATAAGSFSNLYGCVFGDTTTCSVSGIALPTTGNSLMRATQPTVTVAANPTTGVIGAPLPSLGYSVTGLVNGDTAAGALAGTLSATLSGTNTYTIGQGTLVSPLGYNIAFTPSILTLRRAELTRHMLMDAFHAENSSDVYGRNLDQPFVCTAASVAGGGLGSGAGADPLASEWGKVRNQPQLSGCLNVTDGGSCSAF
ncbi:S-layer family protein [Piscinibacter sp. HJYY11]|uniref:beta strand repeat-containing protein n=1 Tax=Piscinibacter sp. HJYY11 TaxID=2801333 RepID=UPI00191ED198|nr:filamentous hemagglutinin N-terminal domain-containing protein [Piscinibacter sp. HJYY11]MBL0726399.1 filamentous hemagglutinin N-terminal domain-containing protein [Piscinibacter sp. HJYY11]